MVEEAVTEGMDTEAADEAVAETAHVLAVLQNTVTHMDAAPILAKNVKRPGQIITLQQASTTDWVAAPEDAFGSNDG